MREGWNWARLSDVVTHTIGGTWGKAPGESDVEVLSFGTKAYAKGAQYLNPSSGTERSISDRQYAQRQLFAGDIVLEVSGGSENQPVGRTLYVAEDMPNVVPSSFMRLLRFDRQRIIPQCARLLMQLLYANGTTTRLQSNTTSIRNLNVKGFLDVEVLLPPLAEQRRIVDLIGSLDDAIETAERSVESGQALLLARAGALHEEWASSFEALGSIAPPKALIGGPFGSSLTRKHYSAEGVPVIRGANMSHRGPYVGGEFVFVLEEKADELRRNEARPGDVIFTQRGTLGQVSLVPDGEYDRYIISQSQMRLRVNPGRDLAKFVYYAFLAPQIVGEIISRNTATANPHINLGILASLQIPRPPLEDQRAAVELMDSLAATHDALKASVDRLRDLRSNLLTVLLSGEHEIPESYDELMEEAAA